MSASQAKLYPRRSASQSEAVPLHQRYGAIGISAVAAAARFRDVASEKSEKAPLPRYRDDDAA